MNIPAEVFVFLLRSGLDLTLSKLINSCRQDPYGSKAYIRVPAGLAVYQNHCFVSDENDEF